MIKPHNLSYRYYTTRARIFVIVSIGTAVEDIINEGFRLGAMFADEAYFRIPKR